MGIQLDCFWVDGMHDDDDGGGGKSRSAVSPPPVCLPACLPACPSAQDPFSLSSPPLASLLIVLLSASRTKPADSALECELEEEDFWRLKDRREGGREGGIRTK